MPFSDLRWSRPHVELAMDIAMTLADLTQSLETSQKIPAFLSQALDLEPLTIAIIADQKAGAPASQVLFHASAGPIDTAAPDFLPNLLAIHQHSKPLAPADGPTLRHAFDPSELEVERPGGFPRVTVFSRALDDKHRMLLVLHQHGEDAGLSAGLNELLQLIADKLAKLLACQITWRSQKNVAEPFDRLTQREWMVLQGLITEAGEKQLADDLGLSPHTLHSHIKSIYRKVGVQGRLLLMARVQKALGDLRYSCIANTKMAVVVEKENAAIVAAV